jgi:hypothetical protein
MISVQAKYNPLEPMVTVPPSLKFGNFNHRDRRREMNFINLDHKAIGVPWNTSLPAARQSRYWDIAESAARNIIHMLMDSEASSNGALPKEIYTTQKTEKIEELVQTAASAAIYLYPSASSRKIALLTQTSILLWIHDGIFTRAG